MLWRGAPRRDKLFCALCAFFVTSAVIFVFFHQALVERTLRSNLESNNADCGKNDYFSITLWDKDVCKRTFENLALYPKFPFYPDLNYSTNRWSSVLKEIDKATITRVQTHLRPIESGFYKFRLGSSSALRIFLEASCSGEITAIVQSRGGRNNEPVYSKSYLLYSHCSYYFEIIIFSLPGENKFNLEWLVPGDTEFREIQSREFVRGPRMELSRHPLVRTSEEVPPNKHSLLSFIPNSHITQIFPLCSSANHEQPKSWTNLAQKTVVYVPPGERPRVIHESVQVVMAMLDGAIPRKYPSSKIIKIEITPNSTHSEPLRLLVDLELTVDGLDYKQRLGEYYFGWYHGKNLTLCRPSSYQWNRLVELNFVFLADCYEKQSVWVEYFIQNMAQLLQASLDVHFKVVVTTCDEEAARSYESRLRRSGFDRYAVVLLEGVYSESRGMKAVMSVVEDSESIVVLCDSQVNMPAVILEEIRKHTFKNAMAFSPIPFQLDCGYFPGSVSVEGDWCPQCASLVALYKEDWATALTDESEMFYWKNGSGPTSYLKDKHKLLQRITNSGIEVIQVNQNGLYRL